MIILGLEAAHAALATAYAERDAAILRAERAERAARNWNLAAKALRSLAIMAGVRKSFYQPFGLRRWK